MTDRTIQMSEAVIRQAVSAMMEAAPYFPRGLKPRESLIASIDQLNAALRQDVQQPDHVGDANKMVATPPAAPARQALDSYVLQLLIAAGHVTQSKVDEARQIADCAHGITKEGSNHG